MSHHDVLDAYRELGKVYPSIRPLQGTAKLAQLAKLLKTQAELDSALMLVADDNVREKIREFLVTRVPFMVNT